MHFTVVSFDVYAQLAGAALCGAAGGQCQPPLSACSRPSVRRHNNTNSRLFSLVLSMTAKRATETLITKHKTALKERIVLMHWYAKLQVRSAQKGTNFDIYLHKVAFYSWKGSSQTIVGQTIVWKNENTGNQCSKKIIEISNSI